MPEGWTKVEEWPDYPKEYGLTQGDIPELIRLATDDDLYSENTEEEYPEAAMWAAIHALRALGQLKSTQAIEPRWDEPLRKQKLTQWQRAVETVIKFYAPVGHG